MLKYYLITDMNRTYQNNRVRDDQDYMDLTSITDEFMRIHQNNRFRFDIYRGLLKIIRETSPC